VLVVVGTAFLELSSSRRPLVSQAELSIMRRWIAPDRDIGTGMFLRNVAPSAEVFQRFQRECAPASATGSLALYGSIAAELPDPSGIFSPFVCDLASKPLRNPVITTGEDGSEATFYRRSPWQQRQGSQNPRPEPMQCRVWSGSWSCENHSEGRPRARLIQTERRLRMKDSPRAQARFFSYPLPTASSVL
jgi:hypothetical protein